MLEKNGGEPYPNGVCRKRSKTPYLTCRYLFSIDTERTVEDWISSFEGMKDKDEPTLPVLIIPIGVDYWRQRVLNFRFRQGRRQCLLV